MRNELLYVGANNKLVDMDDSTNITLKYKNNIFTDIGKIVSNTSYTIKLPKHSEESVCISSRRPAILPIFRCFILP